MPPNSLSFFSAQADDKKVKNKAAGMWKCVGKSPDSVGGHFYHFQLKEKYDRYRHPYSRKIREAIQQKDDKLYPAIESNFCFPLLAQNDFRKDQWLNIVVTGLLEQDISRYAWHEAGNIDIAALDINKILTPELKKDIAELDTTIDFFKLVKKISKICLSAYDEGRISFEQINEKLTTSQYDIYLQKNEIYRQLGYSSQVEADGGLTLTLPNRRSFLTRWEAYRQAHSQVELPELDIQNQKGVASDLEFISCFLKHDVLLSTGREFLHDHMFHVVNLIVLIFNENQEGLSAAEKYYKEKTRIRSVISLGAEAIQNAKLAFPFENDEKLPQKPIKINDLLAIEMALAIITDALASYISYDNNEFSLSRYNHEMLDENIPLLWDEERNQNFWMKRWAFLESPFPVPEPPRIRDVWARVKSLVSPVHTPSSFSKEEDNSSKPGCF